MYRSVHIGCCGQVPAIIYDERIMSCLKRISPIFPLCLFLMKSARQTVLCSSIVLDVGFVSTQKTAAYGWKEIWPGMWELSSKAV